MTKTDTRDVEATVSQIKRLEKAGCRIVRCAVPDEESARAIGRIKKQISIPLVADVHFNYKLAVISAEMGADKLRINPGNIGGLDKIRSVVSAAKERNIPIRVGVNSGSLERPVKAKFKHVSAKALVESALKNVLILEKLKFRNMVVSLKATSVVETIKAYQMISRKINYPLHLGITEAGIPKVGIVKSSVGIGTLLSQGIGDTIRVSLTSEPEEEVRVAYQILKALGKHKEGLDIISCPTCGRTEIDVRAIAEEVESRTRSIKTPLTVAIMGCEVNGPGEAADADVGLAGGKGVGLIFREGKIVRKVAESEMVDALVDEIESMVIK